MGVERTASLLREASLQGTKGRRWRQSWQKRTDSPQYGAPKTDFNVVDLQTGERMRLADGTMAEVVSNPRDGMWVMVRFLDSPSDPSQNDTEGLAFAEDIVEVFEA